MVKLIIFECLPQNAYKLEKQPRLCKESRLELMWMDLNCLRGSWIMSSFYTMSSSCEAVNFLVKWHPKSKDASISLLAFRLFYSWRATLRFPARRFSSTSFTMPLIRRTMNDIYPFISPSKALKDSAKGKTVLVTGGGKGIGRVGKIPSYFAFHPLIS